MPRWTPILRECQAVCRAAWPWALLIAGELIIRMLFDTFAPPAPTGYGPRSAVTTWAAIATFLLAGAVAAARSGRINYGPAVAFAAGIGGHVLGIAAALLLYFSVIVRDADKLATFDMTGGWGEAVGFTVIAPIIGMALGLIGGGIGLALSRLRSFGHVGQT